MDERSPNSTIEQLELLVAVLRGQNAMLRRRVEQLEAQLRSRPPGPPSMPGFVMPPVPPRKNRKPGRGEGHEAALRALPAKIDQTLDVPLPPGPGGGCRCPRCSGELADLKSHERMVEDIVPATVRATRYRTSSGFCRHCNQRVESRHADQPPAANLPHAQLGLNALTMAAVLKHDAGLPYRKVTRLLSDLCGLSVSPGALPKQMRRLSRWLADPYGQIKEQLRQSKFVHADETGARVNGRNHWLWVLTSPRFTLFHLDKSRGGQVPRQLLGEEFAGYLISDFFSAYNTLPYRKQKCLVHPSQAQGRSCCARFARRPRRTPPLPTACLPRV